MTRTSLRLRLLLLQSRASGARASARSPQLSRSAFAVPSPSGGRGGESWLGPQRPRDNREKAAGRGQSGVPGVGLVPGRRAPRLTQVALSLRRPDKQPGSAGPRATDWARGRARRRRRGERRSPRPEEVVPARGSARCSSFAPAADTALSASRCGAQEQRLTAGLPEQPSQPAPPAAARITSRVKPNLSPHRLSAELDSAPPSRPH